MAAFLHLIREEYTNRSTIGRLYIDEEEYCFTLENPYLGNNRNVSCIPTGVYRWRKRLDAQSKYKYEHLHIYNVPNRNWILVHIGNFPQDTLGCILPGRTKGEDAVLSSKPAFDGLMHRLKGVDEGLIKISDTLNM